MFEQALFDYIENNFTLANFTLQFGFGNIPENKQNPYIVQFSLDADGSRSKQTVCGDNSFGKGGDAFIQWNIYSQDATNSFYIKRELDKFISEIRSLTFETKTYKIYINNPGSSPVGQFSNGMNLGILTKTLTYEII